MRPQITTILGLALLLGCGGGERDTTPGGGTAGETGMTADTTVTGAAGDTASSGTPTGERDASLGGILSRLEIANTAEIRLSEVGTAQAQSPAVKEIANTLLTQHRKNRTELEALAEKQGVDLVAAAGGTVRDTSGELALRSLEGAAFDSAFVAGQIEAHRTNVNAIRNQMLPAAEDADVRQYLQKTLAAMEKHLADLQEIQGQLQR